jgi:hypothetical protein
MVGMLPVRAEPPSTRADPLTADDDDEDPVSRLRLESRGDFRRENALPNELRSCTPPRDV